jgi:hypothetical protein
MLGIPSRANEAGDLTSPMMSPLKRRQSNMVRHHLKARAFDRKRAMTLPGVGSLRFADSLDSVALTKLLPHSALNPYSSGAVSFLEDGNPDQHAEAKAGDLGAFIIQSSSPVGAGTESRAEQPALGVGMGAFATGGESINTVHEEVASGLEHEVELTPPTMSRLNNPPQPSN